MSNNSNLTRTACAECDLLIALPEIRDGQRANCPRCGNLLTQHTPQGFERAAAFAIAAVVFLMIAMAFPFLALSSSGLENVMTLPQAALSVYRNHSPVLALIVFVGIIGAPTILLTSLLALTVPLVLQRPVPWLPAAGKLVTILSEWNMVEVFVIGVIVSLVKIGHLAHVIIGLSFWAYLAFAFCLTAALSGLDRLEVWRAIEAQSA
jgi:paraquat-inducible protein A